MIDEVGNTCPASFARRVLVTQVLQVVEIERGGQ